MPDQVGTSDSTIAIAHSLSRFSLSPYNYWTTGNLHKVFVYNDHLYALVVDGPSGTTGNGLQRLYRIRLGDQYAQWSLVASRDQLYSGYTYTSATCAIAPPYVFVFGTYCAQYNAYSGYDSPARLDVSATSPGWSSNGIPHLTSNGNAAYFATQWPNRMAMLAPLFWVGTRAFFTGAGQYTTSLTAFISIDGAAPSGGLSASAHNVYGLVGAGVAYHQASGLAYCVGGRRQGGTTVNTFATTPAYGSAISVGVTGNAGVSSARVDAYSPSSNAWTYNALPQIPIASGVLGGGVVIAGDVLYVFSSDGLNHFYDLRTRPSGSWVPFPTGPLSGFTESQLTYDPVRNQIICLYPNGGYYTMQLTDNGFPAEVGFSTRIYPNATVGVVVTSVASIDILVTAAGYDIIAIGAVDTAFAILTSGVRILSHVSSYIPPTTIVLSSTGTGLSGEAGTETAGVTFDIVSLVLELVPDNEPVSIVIGSVGAAVVLFHRAQIDGVGLSIALGAEGSALAGCVGSAVLSALWFASAAAGHAGVSGGCSVALSLGAAGAGSANLSGAGAAQLQIYLATANGVTVFNGSVVRPGDSVDAWVVNLDTGGHACFTNYKYNSFFELGGRRYACASDGLYELTGTRDSGASVDGYAVSAVTDFGDHRLKYINSAYAHMRTDGDVAFRLVADEQTDRSGYLVSYDNRQGIHRRRRKLAKGVRGTNWQAEIRNVDGADMELAKLELDTDVSSRAVR